MSMHAHIPTREARNAQNEHILVAGQSLRAAVAWLISHGFTVLSYSVDGRPLIWIQACDKCGTLRGVEKIRRGRAGVRESVMAAVVQDCQVQWVERKH